MSTSKGEGGFSRDISRLHHQRESARFSHFGVEETDESCRDVNGRYKCCMTKSNNRTHTHPYIEYSG